MHSCPDCGIEHEAPEPVVIEPDPAPAVEAEGEANVEVARIEGETAIKLARIQAGTDRAALDAKLGELEAELRGQREILQKLLPAPEPAPAPVVVNQADDTGPEMPPRAEKESGPRKAPQRRGFFG